MEVNVNLICMADFAIESMPGDAERLFRRCLKCWPKVWANILKKWC